MPEGIFDDVESTAIVRPADEAEQLPGLLNSPLARMTPAQVDKFVDAVDRVAETRQRMIQICVKRSEPKDWVDFGGKPYLQGQGGQRIASVVGIEIGPPVWGDERWDGEDFFCDVSATFYWPLTGARVTEIGFCSTRDKFFAADSDNSKYNQCLRQCNGDRHAAANMLRGEVRKKALSNCVGRGVSAVMGIKGLSWESLAKYGLTPEQSGGRVAFDGNKAKGAAQPQQQRSQGSQSQPRGTAGTGQANQPAGRKPAAPRKPAQPDRWVDLFNLPAEPVGSIVGISAAYIDSARARQVKVKDEEKTVTDMELSLQAPDGTAFRCKASLFGSVDPKLVGETSPCVRFLRCKVGEYKGQAQYTVDGIEVIEAADQQPDQPGDDAPPIDDSDRQRAGF